MVLFYIGTFLSLYCQAVENAICFIIFFILHIQFFELLHFKETKVIVFSGRARRGFFVNKSHPIYFMWKYPTECMIQRLNWNRRASVITTRLERIHSTWCNPESKAAKPKASLSEAQTASVACVCLCPPTGRTNESFRLSSNFGLSLSRKKKHWNLTGGSCFQCWNAKCKGNNTMTVQ